MFSPDARPPALCLACLLALLPPLSARLPGQSATRPPTPGAPKAAPPTQPAPSQPPCESTLQPEYDTAQRLQSTASVNEAGLHFTLFIAQALHCLAQDRAAIGQYARAVPLFTQALELHPTDLRLRLDFASAALAARDFPRAKALLAPTLQPPCNGKPCAEAHLLLGKALFGLGDLSVARDEFERAVKEEPTFDHGYALARAYLALADKKAAAAIFAELLPAYGDTAAIHLEFGKAYAEADFPEEATREFKQTLTRDPHYPEAHYCLGAAYLMQSGDTDFPHAEAEFRAELALHPDDYFSYSQLGYIAMSRHNLPEAEADLTRAARLNPQNPDNFLLLGQIYAQLNRPTEAESALRQAIAVTSDPSRNHFQIRGAHYQLGQLLLARGAAAEGKREMQITHDLLLQNRLQDEVNLTGKPVDRYRFSATLAATAADPQAEAAAADFEQKLRPALADAYNNLGVSSAKRQAYKEAEAFFQQSAAWNPQAEDLDLNWGRAAFAAKDYPQARACLSRYLGQHPAAATLREPLGISAFMTADYPAALSALQPLAQAGTLSTLAAYSYAESLLRTGDYPAGIARLQALAGANPQSNVFPLALARAYVSHQKWEEAAKQLETAGRLRLNDPETEYLLALTLFALHQQGPAAEHLTRLEALTPQLGNAAADAQLRLQIAALELAHGRTAQALANLRQAVALAPNDPAASQAFIAACRRLGQNEEAEREAKRYAALHSEPNPEPPPKPIASPAPPR